MCCGNPSRPYKKREDQHYFVMARAVFKGQNIIVQGFV